MKKVRFFNDIITEDLYKDKIMCESCKYKIFQKEKRELFKCIICCSRYICETCIITLASEYKCIKCDN